MDHDLLDRGVVLTDRLFKDGATPADLAPASP
jgi:hypothetical protein